MTATLVKRRAPSKAEAWRCYLAACRVARRSPYYEENEARAWRRLQKRLKEAA